MQWSDDNIANFIMEIIKTSECTVIMNCSRIPNIASLVERPYIYLIGLCESSVYEQTQFCEARIEDLRCLETPIEVQGRKYTDTLRFMGGMQYMSLYWRQFNCKRGFSTAATPVPY